MTHEFGTWYPIESAPMDGTPVDLWCCSPGLSGGGYARKTDCWFSDGTWWQYDDLHGDDQCRSAVYNAYYWMPLPPPPEKEE